MADPIAGDESIGVFRVYIPGFMDPDGFYKVGRSMTFLPGEFTGARRGLVVNINMFFPNIAR